MNWTVTSWLIISLALFSTMTFAVWSRVPTRARGLTVLAALFSSPLAGVSLLGALSYPVPLVQGVTAPAGDYNVLGVKMIVDDGIYLFLDGGGKPRYYVTPWDPETAKKIQEQLDANNGEGMRAKVKPFEFSWETRKPPMIYEDPQPKLMPDKPQDENNRGQTYERSA